MKKLHTITTPEIYEAPIGELRSTCRLGRKWMDLEPSEMIELTLGPSDTERNHYGYALVESIEYLRFSDLEKDRHIQTNHSRRSRMGRNELQAAMVRAYGESKFTDTSAVTVLFYRRIVVPTFLTNHSTN